tara:strand:+ start:25 stop:672 length:648 start_codon:yes stop_codon:yes gene_type:complete
MPYTELGSSSTLKLKVPTKGTTNWDEELKTNTFQKITDHDHTGTDGKGSKIANAALVSSSGSEAVNTNVIRDDAITNAKMADDSVNTNEIVDSAVTTAKIADSASESTGVTTAKLADNNITIAKKKTYDLTLNGSPQSLTDLVTSADQAFKINYKIKDAAGTSVQIGTLTGQAGDYKVDEFVGTDLGAAFSYSTNQLQINGTSTNVLTYSIEFLE